MKDILVLSKAEFSNILFDQFVPVVRIVDPSDFATTKRVGYKEELLLAFNDVEEPIGHYTPIEGHQAFQIVSFLQRNQESDRFIFHCNHGQSRSHTCALFFAQEILKDDALASLLASAHEKSINYAVWNALKAALHDILYEEGAHVR